MADLRGPREIEIKLRLRREHVPRLRRHPLLSDGFKQSGKREQQDSVYFDDRRRTLQKKGFSLRVRQIGERRIQTIKASNGHAGPIDRGEWETAVTASRPDLAAAKGTPLEGVLAKLRDPLEPLFETRVSRTAFPVQFGNSDITFSLDQGRIDTGKSTAPICELELELKNGSAGDLFQLARQLDEKIPLELSYETKSGRGYSLLDESFADTAKAQEISLRPGMSCAETFRVIAHECLRHMMQNREGIVQGKAEALHQMRIAVRRFRSTLTFFGDIVSGPGADHVKAQFQWLRDLTGPARDFDVFVKETLEPLRTEFPKDRGVARFYRQATRQQAKANGATRKAVQSAQFRKLVVQTAGWIEGGDWRTGADALMRARQDAPIQYYAADQLSTLRRKVRKQGKFQSELDDRRLHRLRVRTKKLRYAAEFFASLASSKKGRKQTRELLETLRALQDKLGVLNDLAVHRALSLRIARDAGLSSSVRAPDDHGELPVPDMIAHRQGVNVERLLEEAIEAFSAFRDVKRFWKSWPSKPQVAGGHDAGDGAEAPDGAAESLRDAA
jgi:triphosphatase